MMRLIAYEFFKIIQSNQKWKRRLKIFAIVSVTGLVVGLGMFIWAGVSAVSYVASNINQVQVPLPQLSDQLVPQVSGSKCLVQLQSMANFQVWTNNPPAQNFQIIKDACFVKPEA